MKVKIKIKTSDVQDFNCDELEDNYGDEDESNEA